MKILGSNWLILFDADLDGVTTGIQRHYRDRDSINCDGVASSQRSIFKPRVSWAKPALGLVATF